MDLMFNTMAYRAMLEALKAVDAKWGERFGHPNMVIVNDDPDRDEGEWGTPDVELWRQVQAAIAMTEDKPRG
jgi:hypothetical protein